MSRGPAMSAPRKFAQLDEAELCALLDRHEKVATVPGSPKDERRSKARVELIEELSGRWV